MAVGAAYTNKRTFGRVTAIWSCKIRVDCHQDAGSQQAVSTNFVCYYRVSTAQQGQSGLGLEAQRQAVRDYAQKVHGTILEEQLEVESGKRADRPVLNNAIQRCRDTGATLLVAKLDRLSRNLHFITTLQQSKVNFLAVDNPHATPFLIHILVAVAEYERTMISTRTKSALQAAKRRGVRLGNPRLGEAVVRSSEARKTECRNRLAVWVPTLHELRTQGVTRLSDLADGLNRRGFTTSRGCRFTPTHIHRILRALE
jgi:DNA invertase Pin-like site-specific DNA recombinase